MTPPPSAHGFWLIVGGLVVLIAALASGLLYVVLYPPTP